jgi:hypothetical protein
MGHGGEEFALCKQAPSPEFKSNAYEYGLLELPLSSRRDIYYNVSENIVRLNNTFSILRSIHFAKAKP